MRGSRGRRSDLRDDPGLQKSSLRGERGPYVGTPPRRPIRRFAREPALNELLLELQHGFGPQHWWPAETPFEVVVGAILTQNTTWNNVERALVSLKREIPLTPARLLDLDPETLADLLRPSGYFNAKAKKIREISAWYIDVGGLKALRTRPLEPLRRELLGIWGVGPETADSILCYAAGRLTAIVDTYTRRILDRHALLEAGRAYEDVRAWLMERLVRSQSVYEEFHALCVRVGYEHCKPKARCASCPVTSPARLPLARLSKRR